MKTAHDFQAEAEQIKFLIEQVGIPKLFAYFNNTAVLGCLRSRGLHQFLLNIPSHELRKAVEQREELEDENARNQQRTRIKYNVLDFTVQELVKHCWSQKLINLFDYKNYQGQKCNIKDHHDLGMRLVLADPDKYEVGNKSHHFNRARKIQQMYGIRRNRSEWAEEDDFNEDGEQQEEEQEQQDYSNEDNQEQEMEEESQKEQSESELINDEEEQSDYSIPESQLSKTKKEKKGPTKMKLIKKSDKKKSQGLRSRRFAQAQNQSSQKSEDNKPNHGEKESPDQLFFQSDSQFANEKTGEKQTKKKLTIDSDQSS